MQSTPAPLSVVGEVVDMAMLLRDVDAIHPDLIVLEWELPGRVGTHADVLRVLRASARSAGDRAQCTS